MTEEWDNLKAQVRYRTCPGSHPEVNPTSPLQLGTYRLEWVPGLGERWEPVSLDEWRDFTADERLEIILSQMHQSIRRLGEVGRLEIDLREELQQSGLLPREIALHVQTVICMIYKKVLGNEAEAYLWANICRSLLDTVFSYNLPFGQLTDEAVVSLILLYGRQYCERAVV